MDIATFKKIGRILKQAYSELEIEALKNGINLVSPEYDVMQAELRESVLTKFGYTIEEYREAKAESERIRKQERPNYEEIKSKVDSLDIPTIENIESLIVEIATRIAKEHIVAPQIINKIVKEVQLQSPPQVVEKTIVEQITERVEYDDSPLLNEINSFKERLNDFAEKVQTEKLRDEILEDVKGYFGKEFKRNIDILGMPDFRKLAMGLRQDIDDLITNGSSSGGGGHTIQDEGTPLTQRTNLNFVGAGVTVTDDVGNDTTIVTISTSSGAGYQAPTGGAVNGTNAIFTWAVEPNAISVDGLIIRKTASDGTVNWSGTTTVTLSVAPTFDIFGVA